MNNTPKSEHNDGKPEAGVSQSRRRLLKASAAVPVVATLHPGAAMAAASAFQCTGGDFSNKKFEENGNSLHGDNAVRVQVDYYQALTSHAELKQEGYGRRSKKMTVKLPQKLYAVEGGLYDQDGKNHPEITPDILGTYYEHDIAHVLVVYAVGEDYIDVLGPWPKFQLVDNQQPLTQSCWTSLTGVGYVI